MRSRYVIAAAIVMAGTFVAVGIMRHAFAASPTISDVIVQNVAATSTTVVWTSNLKTDSYIDFSLDTNYCGVRNAGDFGTDHAVVIPNLDPATT